MSKHHSFIDTVDQVITDAVNKGIMHLNTKDSKLIGNKIILHDKEVINFGSCSYLGLEFDQRMIESSMNAVKDYGTQFSASRAYVSSKYYEELEDMFEQIFDSPSVVAPTTTLGHMGTIPVIINDDDAIILDHQVHNSVQTAVNLVKPRGIHVEIMRHNRMDLLEDRVKLLRQKYKRIWYMADGIYSMYGDATPVNDVYELMNKYGELHYYIDDAHGMSCYGKHGRGYVLSQKPMHEKMVFAASLAKAFATGGAVLSFPTKELARKVRTCAASLVTSGPMQPSVLGAAIASAKIHLSNEINGLQEDLMENIKYCNLMIRKYGLPSVAETNSPVFFIGVSLPKLGYSIIKKMLDEGYYLNHGIFPGVPIKNTGVRFTITRLHTFEQIENMIATMAYHFPRTVEEEGFSMEKIYRAFKMQIPEEKQLEKIIHTNINAYNLEMQHETTIDRVKKEEWNHLLGSRGTFNWAGLKFLENSFSCNEMPENNWGFDYVIIRDGSGKPVLATFLTTSVSKDDIFSPASISKQLETKRQTDDPYYLTSKTLSIGSLLTEGNHLYLDRTSPVWKNAMHLLFEKISELQEKYDATVIMLRDFDGNDQEMDAFLVDNGYFKINMPENHVMEHMNWNNKEEYLSGLTPSSSKHVKRYILKNEDKFEVECGNRFISTEELKDLYQLYLNVKDHSLALNTFTLPYKVFENMVKDGHWDIITLKIKPEYDTRERRKPVAVMFNYIAGDNYNFMIIGIDYQFQDEYKPYKQALYQVIKRARELNLKKVNMGFTTTIEKRKLGAKVFIPAAYVQAKDNFNLEVLGTMSVMEMA